MVNEVLKNVWDGLYYIIQPYDDDNVTIIEFDNPGNWAIVAKVFR